MKNEKRNETEQSHDLCTTTAEQHLLYGIKFFFLSTGTLLVPLLTTDSISHLVFPVVLLGVPEHPVAEPADVPEGCVALVPQLLQPQHRPVPAVCERGLQQLENLQVQRKTQTQPHEELPSSAQSECQSSVHLYFTRYVRNTLQSPRFLEQPGQKMLLTFTQQHLLEFLVPAMVSLQSTAQSLLKAGNSKEFLVLITGA